MKQKTTSAKKKRTSPALWLVTRPIVWPTRAALGTVKLTGKATTKTAAGSFKAGYRTGRAIGFKRVTVLAVGVGVGLLVAPRTGRETRELVRQRLVERGLISPPAPSGDGVLGATSPSSELPSSTSNGQSSASPTAVSTAPDDPGATPT